MAFTPTKRPFNSLQCRLDDLFLLQFTLDIISLVFVQNGVPYIRPIVYIEMFSKLRVKLMSLNSIFSDVKVSKLLALVQRKSDEGNSLSANILK